MNEGLLDANLPMNYTTSLSTFQTRSDDILQHSYGRHVYMGVGAYLLDVSNTVAQLRYARTQNAPGLLFFSYAANSKGRDWLGCFKTLQQEVFSTPAVVPDMPWKVSPTTGALSGRVVVKSDGSPIYNARLVIPELRKMVRTDGQGYFGLPLLAPGTYVAICQSPGFQLEEMNVVIQAGGASSLTFALDPGECAQLVLDTEDAQFTGDWTIGVSAVDKFGMNYRFIGPGNGSQKAVFPLPKDLNGRYRVYTWYSRGSNRTRAAGYHIYHGSGVDKVSVDQQKNAGMWYLLGTWDFQPSQYAAVHIGDLLNSGEVVIADAIQLERVKPR
jgi:hypothetical protein